MSSLSSPSTFKSIEAKREERPVRIGICILGDLLKLDAWYEDAVVFFCKKIDRVELTYCGENASAAVTNAYTRIRKRISYRTCIYRDEVVEVEGKCRPMQAAHKNVMRSVVSGLLP